MTIELRPYQRDAVDSLFRYFGDDNPGNPLVVVPTGGGKTAILGTFVREVYEGCPTVRILIVTHVKELLSQGYEQLKKLWPEAPAGVFSAGLRKREIKAQILFAGIQSIFRRAYELQRVDLLLVDEAQLVPRSSNATYRKFIDDLLTINKNMKIIGMTATPYRLDSGRLHVGDDAIFSDICYEANIRDLIDQGYLSRPVSVSSQTQIDTSGVGTRGGEYITGQLQAAANDPATNAAIADEIVEYGVNRRGWLIFGTGLDHCTALRDAIRERGFTCECIFGDTPPAERDAIIEAYKRQEIRALSSMGVLTVGFDAPHTDLIALARPTKSTGLYIQICGRGSRLFPGKNDFAVLDYGNNIALHGPIDAPRIKPEKTKGILDAPAEMPTKACLNHPMCEQRSPISARECVACGCPFPDTVAKISSQASALSILSTAPRVPEWIDVSSVSYRAWPGKDGKPPTVCVTYSCGLMQHREWVCPQHIGYARNKFVAWWREATGQTHAPLTVEDVLAMRNLIRDPVQIQVRPEGKYVAITGRRYEREEMAA